MEHEPIDTGAAIDIEAEIKALQGEAGADPVALAHQEAANQEAAEVEQAQADQVAEYKELLQPVLYMGLNVLAPNWEISAAEADALANGYAPLLQKYFPDGPAKFGPEMGAALVTVAIFSRRIGKPRKAIEEHQEAANDSGGASQAAAGDDVEVQPGSVPE